MPQISQSTRPSFPIGLKSTGGSVRRRLAGFGVDGRGSVVRARARGFAVMAGVLPESNIGNDMMFGFGKSGLKRGLWTGALSQRFSCEDWKWYKNYIKNYFQGFKYFKLSLRSLIETSYALIDYLFGIF